MRMGDGPHDIGLSRKHLIEACEASLRRLRTDYLDLYIGHQPDMLRGGRRDGSRVRRPGAAGQDPLRRLLESCGMAGHESARRLRIDSALTRYVCQQVNYSLDRSRHRARDHPARTRSGASVSWPGARCSGPAHRQVPAGRTAVGQPAERARHARHHRFRAPLQGRRHARRDRARTRRHAGAGGAELGAVQARRRHRHHRGARRGAAERQLAAAAWRLSADEVARLDDVSALPEPYPHVAPAQVWPRAEPEAPVVSREPG